MRNNVGGWFVLQELFTPKGYSGSVFLTNYQLSGGDQSCNLRFSKSIDRHLYFDYPEFSQGRLKVSGRSPLEFLVYWKKRYLNLFSGASECWISEINLPGQINLPMSCSPLFLCYTIKKAKWTMVLRLQIEII